jgi:hypothetical protein
MENFNSHKAPPRDKRADRGFDEPEKVNFVKKEGGRNFTKNQPPFQRDQEKETDNDFFGEKNAFDSEVMRTQN